MSGPQSSWPRKAEIIILFIAFSLRLGWALLIPVVPVADSVTYDALAQTLAFHGIYGWQPGEPTAYWPVGTSAMYAALYEIFGYTFAPIVALNVVLGTAIVRQTMWLAQRFFDERIAIFAGTIFAVWPSQIAYVTILASELPFTFFVLLSLQAWYSTWLSNLSRGALSGIAITLASYVRPVALLLPIVLWLQDAIRLKNLRAQSCKVLLAIIVMALGIAPWSIRNSELYGHPMLLSTNGGVVLWMGNNSESEPCMNFSIPDDARCSRGGYIPEPKLPKMSEYDRDKLLGKMALHYIAEYPFSFIVRTAKKAMLLHFNETIAVVWNTGGITKRLGGHAIFPLKVLMQAFWSVILLLGAAGLAFLCWQEGIILALANPVAATWIYFTVVYSVFEVQDRYHFQSEPFIAILAAVATVRISSSLLKGNDKTVYRTLERAEAQCLGIQKKRDGFGGKMWWQRD